MVYASQAQQQAAELVLCDCWRLLCLCFDGSSILRVFLGELDTQYFPEHVARMWVGSCGHILFPLAQHEDAFVRSTEVQDLEKVII